MKYLIKHKKEFTIAIVTVVFTGWNLIKALKCGVCTEGTLSAFILAVFTLLGLYYNMPTSFEGSVTKRDLQQMKELRGCVADTVEEPLDSEVR